MVFAQLLLVQKCYVLVDIKGTVHPKVKTYIFLLLHFVLFNNLDRFGVSCLVLEIFATEISAFSLI